MRSPSTHPGAITLARTPKGPASIAIVFIMPITAHLLAQYGARYGKPCSPAVDEVKIIEPLPCRFIMGSAPRAVKNAPLILTSKQSANSSIDCSSIKAVGPALVHFVPLGLLEGYRARYLYLRAQPQRTVSG